MIWAGGFHLEAKTLDAPFKNNLLWFDMLSLAQEMAGLVQEKDLPDVVATDFVFGWLIPLIDTLFIHVNSVVHCLDHSAKKIPISDYAYELK